jgi:ribosomal protein S26
MKQSFTHLYNQINQAMNQTFTSNAFSRGKSSLIVLSTSLLMLFLLFSGNVNSQSIDCEGDLFRTQTPGGWGAPAEGNNPGTYRDANFASAFPNGLTIGCNGNTLHLTSASDVEAFLPSGGTASTLPNGSLLNPGSSYNNVLAGHLVALTLNVGFDNYDPNFGESLNSLEDLFLGTGIFQGMTVLDFLSVANDVIGGCDNSYTPSQIVDAATLINEDFIDGQNTGDFLNCLPNNLCETGLDLFCGNIDNLQLECGDSTHPDDTGYPTYQDPSIQNPNCPSIEGLTYSDSESGICPTIITRTWTLTDIDGNTATCVQTISIDDTEDPSLIMPIVTEATAYCGYFQTEEAQAYLNGEMTPADSAAFVAMVQQLFQAQGLIPLGAEDSCDPNPYWEEVSIDIIPVEGCSGAFDIHCNFQAFDNCDNASEIETTYLYIIDNVPPVFNEVIVDLNVQCPEEVPPFEECTATDECSSDDVQVWSFQTSNQEGDETCELTTAVGLGVDWSIWLNALPGASDFYNFVTPGVMQVYNDGSALITGTVAASNNANQIFNVYIRLENKRNWADWSALGRSYKDDALLAGNNYLDWMYYELDANNSFLVGAGDFAGSLLNLNHMPANYFYGFQCGLAANNKNANEGLSGWFTYNGILNGTQVFGQGDVNVDKECEPNNNVSECEYEIERHWFAVDGCGNMASAMQTISVHDTTPPVFTMVPQNLSFECYADVPAPDISQLAAEDNCGGDVVITFELDDQTGNECNATIIRTYQAIDICGNFVKHFQTITVLDNVPPVFTDVPADDTVECDAIPAAYNPVAEDNCSEIVTISLVETTQEGLCVNQYTLFRTWTATDECDNSAIHVQVLNVVDTTDPTFDNAPEDIVASCDNIPAIEEVTASDNCGTATVTVVETDFSGGCAGVIQRIFTATDLCGNTAVHEQYITLIDTVAPVLAGLPADENIECSDDVPAVANVTATDNCDLDVNVEFVETMEAGDCENEYTIFRTWSATDTCENTVSYTQAINVSDNTAPIFTWSPENLFVQCPEDVPAPAELDATDNCDDDVTISFEEVEGPEAQASITTAIGDGYALSIPTFIPGSQNYAFSSEGTFTQFVNGTARLQGNVYSTVYPEKGWAVDIWLKNKTDWEQWSSNGGVFVDDNGLVNNDEFINWDFYVIDADQSRLDGLGDYEGFFLNLSQAAFPANTGFQVGEVANNRNNSWGMYTRFYTNGFFDGQNVLGWGNIFLDGTQGPNLGTECSYDITRIWTATDNCGNTAVVEQIIHVEDTLAPVFTLLPDDLTAECDNLPEPSVVEAEDNCVGPVEITFTDFIVEGNCPNNYTIERTWIAEDQCLNRTSHVQYIEVSDNTPPVFTDVPENDSYECDAIPAPYSPVATDNCAGEVSISLVETTQEGSCPNQYTLFRTWTATDVCNNSSSYTQIINVTDNTNPTFDNAPEDIVASCDNIPDPTLVTASDNCGTATVTMVEVDFSGGCVGVIQRIFTATDLCGNTAVHEQYITLVDTVAPVLAGLPADENIECSDAIPAVADVTATDNCDTSVDVMFMETMEAGDCENEYTIFRTWSAVDTCENAVSYTQVITISDNTAPTFNIPSNEINVACDVEVQIPNPIATDNCDLDVTVVPDFTSTPGECANEWTEVYTWTATDNCGNSSSISFTINYVDDVAPVFTLVPEDLNFACITDVPAADASALQATDTCGDVTIVHQGDVQEGTDCNAVISRTYRATDLCGNFTDHVQLINVYDNIAPVFEFEPVNLTVSCDNVPAPVDCYATDNCSNISAGFSETIVEGCPTIITRIWTATDECGNMASVSQTITVVDSEGPMITACPDAASYNCLADVPAADITLVSGTDNCGEVTVVHMGDVTNGGDCSGVITRTYRVYDACDNFSDCVQTITYNDNVAPTFDNAPEDIVASCDNIPDPILVTASDNCGTATVTFVQSTFSGGCNGSIQRIYTATDLCGNTAVHEQYITLIDTVAPVLSNTPENMDIECSDDIPAAADVTATDNCDDNITVDFVETMEAGDCENNYAIIRTWSAVDTCENAVSYTQIITVSDNTAPVFTEVLPETITVPCDQVPVAQECLATDNCSNIIIYGFSEVSTEGCPYTITRTWTAEDECGNTASQTQVITVVDEFAPVLSMYPENTTVPCNDIPGAPTITATDNCDDDLTVSFVESPFEGCSGEFTRTWSVTDWCGNTTTHVQTITVIDNVNPWFDQVITETLNVECDDLPAVPEVTASDNCDDNVEVVYGEQIVEGNCDGNYTIIRTWTATDNCNNASVLTQTVNVSDNTAPVFVDVPANASYTCDDEIPALEDCIAVDACSNNISYTSVEIIDGYTGEDGLRQCDLSTPFNVIGQPWAVWIPNSIGEPQYYYLSEGTGHFVELPNGRAHLTGTVYATNNPNKRWMIDVYFQDRADWATWSALGRDYKDDALVAGDLYETWDYYIMNADSASLTGDGLYAGAALSLSHMPASYNFGFQVGEAANNRNAADGMSGWFSYMGTWNNGTVVGIGDFGFESDCPACDYTITRIWTATDGCGNTATTMQVITVQPGDTDLEEGVTEQSIGRTNGITLAAWPNPTALKSTINFNVPFAGRVTLEVFNMDGKLIETLYSGEVMADQDYYYPFDASSLSNGIYLYKMTTSKGSHVEKLMIVK